MHRVCDGGPHFPRDYFASITIPLPQLLCDLCVSFSFSTLAQKTPRSLTLSSKHEGVLVSILFCCLPAQPPLHKRQTSLGVASMSRQEANCTFPFGDQSLRVTSGQRQRMHSVPGLRMKAEALIGHRLVWSNSQVWSLLG